MDLGDLDGHDAEGIKASLRQANGGVLPANGAVNLAGMSRAFKDSELRRLEDEVCVSGTLPQHHAYMQL
jgi:hypothetical protein